MDSASPFSFLKSNVYHELKLREPYLKTYPVDQPTKDLYCGFTDNAINITGKLIVPVFSNELAHKESQFFLTEDHRRTNHGIDNLPQVEIEVSQKHLSHFQTKKIFKSINLNSTADKDREIEHVPNTSKQLFHHIGK